ncbi:MAG: hypothetical protein H0U12_13375 [Thermoleophilaceae bacterium]|nr:hypothetical protein [Thermoleophilaceae bacterium]
MADARRLLELAGALGNQRQRRMRQELRERVGEALGVQKRHRDSLDCVESDQVFLILKPEKGLVRDDFADDALRPLLRQAIVAIAAAVETYVAEQSNCMIGTALSLDPLPKGLREFSVSMGDVLDLERYERRGWGYRRLLADHLRQESSAAPSKIGQVFGTVGVEKLWKQVDAERNVKKGTSETQMDALAKRRNQIAHSADWVGRGRAQLGKEEVIAFERDAREIVEAIDSVVT